MPILISRIGDAAGEIDLGVFTRLQSGPWPERNRDHAFAIAPGLLEGGRHSAAISHDADCLTCTLKSLSEADANLSRNAHMELTLETMFIQLARASRRPVTSGTGR